MTRWLFLALTPLLCLPASSQDEHRERLRKTMHLLEKDDENLGELLFLRRREVREYDADGKLKSKRSVTSRREPYEELVVGRVIARNDQPLTAEELKQQEESIKAGVASFRAAQAKQKDKKPSSGKKDGENLFRDIPEAFDFKLVGTEKKLGHEALVYEFTPRKGYSPRSFKLKFLEKTKGTAWVDKATSQLIYADAEVYETVNVGLGLIGRMTKGTQFRLQRNEVAPGIWAVESQHFKFDARFMLVKTFRQEVDERRSEFRQRPRVETSAGKRAAQ
jgi:hypothetical protein